MGDLLSNTGDRRVERVQTAGARDKDSTTEGQISVGKVSVDS